MSGVFCMGCGGVFSDQKHLRGCGCDDALKADLAKREKDADLRAALAKAEQDIEDRDRAIESLRLKVDTAHGQIDALKARVERLAAECRAWRTAESAGRVLNPRTNVGFVLNQLDAARAAVDAHGDLEATP